MPRPWYPELLDDVAAGRDVKQRLDDLDRAHRLGHSSIDAGTLRIASGGAITYTDTDGNVVRHTPTPPTTPTGLTAVAGTDELGTWVDATWNPVEDVLNYRIELTEDGVGRVAGISTEVSAVRFTGLQPDTTYTVRVTAVNHVGFSSHVETQVTTGTDATVPAQATGLVVTGGINLIVARWTASQEADLHHYDLEVASNATFTTGQQTFSTPALVQVVTSLAAGTWYARVRAVDSSGNAGPWSASGSATVADSPAGRNFTTNPITTTEITDSAITSAKIAANTITAGDIAADTITGTQIAAGSIAAADAVFATAAIQSADINTLTVAKLTSGEMTASIFTLAPTGVIRGGRTASPFHYFVLSGLGLEFWSNGTAAYTGGTRKLLMDVSTGNVSIAGSLTVGGPGNTATSFTVLAADGDTTMVADENEVGAQRIRTDELYVGAARIGQMTSDITIYVDPSVGNNANTGATWATAVKHINEALRRIPKIVNMAATIYVKSGTTAYEEVRIEGFTGGGTLRLEAEAPNIFTTIYGSLYIGGCALREIQIVNRFGIVDSGQTSDEKNSSQWKNDDNMPTYPGTVTISGSTFVRFVGSHPSTMMDIDSKGIRRFSLFAANGSQVEARHVWMINANDACMGSYRHSQLIVWNTGGGAAPGTLTFWVTWNGKIVAMGTGPAYSGSDNYVIKGGSLFKDGYSSTNRTPPAAPTVNQYTTKWIRTGHNSYQYYPGAPKFRNDGAVRQGNYGYGNHKGYWYFDSTNIRAVLAGSVINSVRFFMRRAATGGSSAAQDHHLCVHNQDGSVNDSMGAFIGGHLFAWGEGRWLSFPNWVGENLRDGSARGIGLFRADGGGYSMCDGYSELEITYTK